MWTISNIQILNVEGGNFNIKEVVELLCEKSNRLKSIVKHNMGKKIVKLLHIIYKESSYSFCAYYSVGWNEISCLRQQVHYGHHYIKLCRLWELYNKVDTDYFLLCI